MRQNPFMKMQGKVAAVWTDTSQLDSSRPTVLPVTQPMKLPVAGVRIGHTLLARWQIISYETDLLTTHKHVILCHIIIHPFLSYFVGQMTDTVLIYSTVIVTLGFTEAWKVGGLIHSSIRSSHKSPTLIGPGSETDLVCSNKSNKAMIIHYRWLLDCVMLFQLVSYNRSFINRGLFST